MIEIQRDISRILLHITTLGLAVAAAAAIAAAVAVAVIIIFITFLGFDGVVCNTFQRLVTDTNSSKIKK